MNAPEERGGRGEVWKSVRYEAGARRSWRRMTWVSMACVESPVVSGSCVSIQRCVFSSAIRRLGIDRKFETAQVVGTFGRDPLQANAIWIALFWPWFSPGAANLGSQCHPN